MAALGTRVHRGIGSFVLAFAFAFGCGSATDDIDVGGNADAGGTDECEVDCPAVCGNGELEEGEGCDDGNTVPGDGCDGSCVVEVAPATAFRLSELSLREPHTFALGLIDVTDTVNTLLTDFITMDKVNAVGDETPDGLLDFSMLAVFRPFDPGSESVPLDIVVADCTAPLSETDCSPSPLAQIVVSVATNMDSVCLDAMPDTTGGYQPPITTPSGPCFVSDAETFDLDFGDIAFSFVDARVAAMYTDGDDRRLASGLIRGFLSESFADGAVLPADLPFVGGKPISELLKDVDKDTGPGGEPGWWFYLNFAAEEVAYTD